MHGKKTQWYYTKSNEDCLVMLSEVAFHLCMEVAEKRYCYIPLEMLTYRLCLGIAALGLSSADPRSRGDNFCLLTDTFNDFPPICML